jgi:hypothetical protein
MPDMMQSGLSWLSGMLDGNAAQTISYTRGATVVTVPAVYGRKLLKLSDQFDGRLVKCDEDFDVSAALIQAAFVAESDTFTAPQRGDIITAVFPEGTQTLEVLAPGGEPHFQLDEYHLRYLIHAMRIT